MDDSQHLINQSPINLSFAENKPDSYSAETSSQELYKILMNKEARVAELTQLVQKLEANIFDLHENIREKDQVIDARTKAITLMSENLSKKGKNTLDTLEDTKQQMRKMQENFVQLEDEMNREKQQLLSKLHQKDLEIESLKEAEKMAYENQEKLSEMSKIEDYQEEIKKLNEALNEQTKENREMAQIIQQLKLETTEKSNQIEEVAKLRKQLDDSNKNMIKLKAQHKSKIKELNKKIETLKKPIDPDSEAAQLRTEISKLSDKLSELEKEKEELILHIQESNAQKGMNIFSYLVL